MNVHFLCVGIDQGLCLNFYLLHSPHCPPRPILQMVFVLLLEFSVYCYSSAIAHMTLEIECATPSCYVNNSPQMPALLLIKVPGVIERT